MGVETFEEVASTTGCRAAKNGEYAPIVLTIRAVIGGYIT
jgi:hypothetical protein